MKTSVKFFAVLVIFSISFSLNAQYNKLYLESNKTYSRGKIYIKRSIQPLEARNIKLVQDTILQYTDTQTDETRSLPVTSSTVNYIKVKSGSRAGSFALYGGGFMCLSALTAALTTEGEQVEWTGETSGINWTPVVLGFTAGGAVIGAAIGAFVPRYTNYYVKTPGMALNVKIVPQYYGKTAGVGLLVTF